MKLLRGKKDSFEICVQQLLLYAAATVCLKLRIWDRCEGKAAHQELAGSVAKAQPALFGK